MKSVKIHMSVHFKTPKLRQISRIYVEYGDETKKCIKRISVTYIQCVRKVAVYIKKVLEVMSTSVYTGLNPFNFIRKHVLRICVRKVAVYLQKLLEVTSTSVDIDNQIYIP
jgi:hypothetical protein